MVVKVSPDPDLVDTVAPISKLPSAASSASTDASLPVSFVLVFVKLILNFPPALKKNLASSPPANVNDASQMCDVSYTADATIDKSSPPAVSPPEALVEPPLT